MSETEAEGLLSWRAVREHMFSDRTDLTLLLMGRFFMLFVKMDKIGKGVHLREQLGITEHQR